MFRTTRFPIYFALIRDDRAEIFRVLQTRRNFAYASCDIGVILQRVFVVGGILCQMAVCSLVEPVVYALIRSQQELC